MKKLLSILFVIAMTLSSCITEKDFNLDEFDKQYVVQVYSHKTNYNIEIFEADTIYVDSSSKHNDYVIIAGNTVEFYSRRSVLRIIINPSYKPNGFRAVSGNELKE